MSSTPPLKGKQLLNHIRNYIDELEDIIEEQQEMIYLQQGD